MMESIEELRGVWVVDGEHGVVVGRVFGMTVDPSSGQIAALVYKARKGKQKYAVPREFIDKVGRDIVLIKSDCGEKIDKIEDAPGVSLRELQGSWVTTLEGKHLGTLVDIDFSPSDWRVSELELAPDKRLPVEAEAVRFSDVILVPGAYEDRIKPLPKERYGFLGRLFGRDRIDDLRHAMGKTLKERDQARQ